MNWHPQCLLLTAVALSLSLPVMVSAGEKERWPKKDYVEVRAYVFTLKGKPARSILDKNGNLRAGMLDWDGVRLTQSQVDMLLEAVTGKHRSHPVAACYEPHHAFVFFDAEKKPAGIIEVCFKCANYRSGPERLAGPFDLGTLNKLVRAAKLPIYTEEEQYAAFVQKQRDKAP